MEIKCGECRQCCQGFEGKNFVAVLSPYDEISVPDVSQHVKRLGGERYASPRGGVLVLPTGEDGNCVMMKQDGCSIYKKRPFDCRQYPLVAVLDKTGRNIKFIIDSACPRAKDVTPEMIRNAIRIYMESYLPLNFFDAYVHTHTCSPLPLPRPGLRTLFRGGYTPKSAALRIKGDTSCS